MQEGERQFASDKDLANPFLPLPVMHLALFHRSDAKRQLMLEHVWQSLSEYV